METKLYRIVEAFRGLVKTDTEEERQLKVAERQRLREHPPRQPQQFILLPDLPLHQQPQGHPLQQSQDFMLQPGSISPHYKQVSSIVPFMVSLFPLVILLVLFGPGFICGCLDLALWGKRKLLSALNRLCESSRSSVRQTDIYGSVRNRQILCVCYSPSLSCFGIECATYSKS